MHSKIRKYKKPLPKFQSTKVFDGYSTVFRQWKATTTHCQYLHGYGISFKLWFEGKLDASDGELLNTPIQYTDKVTFENWLKLGLERLANKPTKAQYFNF